MLGAQSQVFHRAEHAVGLHAADLPAVELQPARQRRSDRGERVCLPRRHVGRAADDLDRRTRARIHLAETQPVGVGMLLDLEDARHDDLAQLTVSRHDAVHRAHAAREERSELVGIERAPHQRLDPAA